MRKLTKRYTSYRLAQYEKRTNKSMIELLNIGNLSISKLAELCYYGNPDFTEIEQAYELIDEFLASNADATMMDVYFTLIEEYDRDIRILKAFGMSAEQLKDQLTGKMQEVKKDLIKNVENLENKTENKTENNIVELPQPPEPPMGI